MDIYYKSSRMQKLFGSAKEMEKVWGKPHAKKIQQRLTELEAADSLSDISHLPPLRLHQLTQNRKGEFAIDTVNRFRLIFIPYHDPLPLKEDGGIDQTRVTKIQIIEVQDYH